MADSKITALTSIGASTDPANDPLVLVDVSDTSMAATGTTKKVTLNQLLGASGTATLASATITGDLTVDTGVLKVDSLNNRVGVGTATPTSDLDIYRATGSGITSGISLRTAAGAGGDGSFIKWLGGGSNEKIAQIDGVLNGTDVGYLSFLCGNGSDAMAEQYRIASSGVFSWYDGAGGTRMTLNSTGLGVGVVPSLYRFEVGSGSTDTRALFTSNNAFSIGVKNGANQLGGWIGSAGNNILTFSGNDGTMKVTIDNTGNVGVGVTPSAWATTFPSYKALEIGAKGNALWSSGSSSFSVVSNAYFDSADTRWEYAAIGLAARYSQDDGLHKWYTAASGAANAAITDFATAKMTLDASGRLLVGQTSTGILNINGIDIEGGDSNGGSYIIVNHKLATASGQQYLFFGYNAVKTGDITQNGTTGVLYNTVSDYRLKESVQPLSNGLSRVSALKPSIYKWKSDGSSGEGFLAHELAEVVPFAVTGEKDALNEDGSVKAQSVDMSRVIPILVAAIQELTARVQTLETR